MSESTVRSFDPAIILEKFFDKIYGEQKGWVYTATKHSETEEWTKYFFRYPEQRNELIEHAVTKSAEHEVYYSPAIFGADCSERGIERQDFKGTNVLWAEFDGHLPDEEKMAIVPKPTIRIRSSDAKHEHWYWHLNFIETNVDALEKLTRAITYHLGADLSGWDYTQVLRPPGTIHHDTGKTVTLLEFSDRRVSIEQFIDIPEVPDTTWDVEVDDTNLPHPLVAIAQYKVPKNDAELLLKKTQEVGKRSAALMRVGYVCAEVGMSNSETFAILLYCDKKWQKFAPRGPERQKKYLLGIIRRARQKHPLNISEEELDAIPYFTFGEFRQMDHKIEWIVDGLIQKNGLPVITGQGGVGKTHMTFQIACHMVAGKPFLKWNFARPMTLCVASMELAPAETFEELNKIIETFTPEEQQIIYKNLHVIPIGSRLPLNKVAAQDKLLRRLEQYKPEGIFFDSLGHSIDGSPNTDDIILDTFDFVKRRINQHYDAFSWFIHHMRKAQTGNKKPKDPDDIYGSAYIHNNATLVINMWKDKPTDEITEFNYLKVRFAKFPPNFKIKRRDPCGFDIVDNSFTYVDANVNSEDTFGDIEF